MALRTFLLVFLSLWALQSPAAPKAFRVMIDPGHGGPDDGAVRNNIREADLVLKISKKVAALINASPDLESQLTRTEEGGSLTLKDRVEMAEAFGADIFISIHANASTDSRVKGAEFYFSPALTAQESALWLSHLSVRAQRELASPEDTRSELTSDVAILLHELRGQQRAWESQELSRSLYETWQTSKSRKTVRQAPFYVVNSNTVPAVLVEIGYLSNAHERALLLNEQHQTRIAEQIFHGLEQFKEFMDKRSAPNLQ